MSPPADRRRSMTARYAAVAVPTAVGLGAFGPLGALVALIVALALVAVFV